MSDFKAKKKDSMRIITFKKPLKKLLWEQYNLQLIKRKIPVTVFNLGILYSWFYFSSKIVQNTSETHEISYVICPLDIDTWHHATYFKQVELISML